MHGLKLCIRRVVHSIINLYVMDELRDLMTSLHAKLDLRRLTDSHADSLKAVGTSFSGVTLCGRSVELVVHTSFDASGVFTSAQAGDILLVMVDPRITDTIACQGIASTVSSIKGMLTVGNLGIAVSLTDIPSIVRMIDRVVSENCELGVVDRMEIYRVPEVFQELAFAILHEHEERKAWIALTAHMRSTLLTSRDMLDTFFTSARLQACYKDREVQNNP